MSPIKPKKDQATKDRERVLDKIAKLIQGANPAYREHLYVVGIALVLGSIVLFVPVKYMPQGTAENISMVLDFLLALVGVALTYAWRRERKKRVDVEKEVKEASEDLAGFIRDEVRAEVMEEISNIKAVTRRRQPMKYKATGKFSPGNPYHSVKDA